ncbi:MAG: cyclic peptide export ABC transporter [Sulfurovum sp.]
MFEHLIQFLKREGDFSFWKNIIFMATVSGIANAGLLAIVNSASNSAQDEGLNYRFFAIYIVIFLIFFITKRYSLKYASIEVEKIIQNARDRISVKIVNSELVTMESLNLSSLFARLTRDTTTISQSAFQITGAAQSVIMIFFSMIYILTISKVAFFIIIITSTIITITYSSFAKEFSSNLKKVNKIEESFITSLRSIIDGFKELKINSYKREKIIEHNKIVLNDLIDSKIKISDLFVTAIMYAEIFLYILLALIVFLLPHLTDLDSITIIKLTAATLFIIGPFGMIIGIIPMVSKTETAIYHIDELEKSLDKAKQNIDSIEDNSETIDEFTTLSLKDIEFYYIDDLGERLFSIGPINLTVKKGETIFIIGGNGSGKSTLVKTLLGLYTPQKGNIYIDDEKIDLYNSQAYRNLFSIILTDFYLFDRFYGLEDIDKKLVNRLLKEMQLNKKTKFIDGRFTNTNLSTGQRKRLALIVSILEDKDIYVFDEWAADQDPEFRKYFYSTILKELKSRGKTVIAVTHDDAYFGGADRVFKIDYGQMSQYKGEI